MVLSPSKAGSPIHLDGYDDGHSGEFQFRDKMSFVLSPDRQQKVDESLKLAGQIKDLIDDNHSSKDQIIVRLQEHFKPLMDMARDLPEPETLKKQTAEIVVELRLFESLVDQKIVQTMVQSAGQLNEFTANVNVPADALTLISEARSLRRATSDVELLSNVRTLMGSGISKAPTVVSGMLETLRKATMTLEAVNHTIDDNLSDIKRIGDKEQLKITESLTVSIDELNTSISSVTAMVNWLSDNIGNDIQKLTEAGGLLAGTDGSKWNAYTVPLQSIRDTYIDMNTVSAEDHDKLVISAEALNHNSVSGVDEPLSSSTGQLRIGSLGWSSNVSGDLLFVQRKGDNRFITATGVSYVYRYRPWEENTKGKRFMAVLNPGIGFSFAALNFPGDSIQLGVGLTGTLLNGLLNVGYGYNLQATNRPGYFFFGLRFVGVADKFKNTVTK